MLIVCRSWQAKIPKQKGPSSLLGFGDCLSSKEKFFTQKFAGLMLTYLCESQGETVAVGKG